MIVGYYVNGRVLIKTNALQITAAALGADAAIEAIGNKYFIEDLRSSLAERNGDDFLARALNASGFEDVYREEAANGDLTYEARYDRKWWEGADFVHRLAADAGMTVDGVFRGEDDEAWVWSSRSGVFIEDGLSEVAGERLRAYIESERLLGELRAILQSDEDPDAVVSKAKNVLTAVEAN
jgi:hypothetical protein